MARYPWRKRCGRVPFVVFFSGLSNVKYLTKIKPSQQKRNSDFNVLAYIASTYSMDLDGMAWEPGALNLEQSGVSCSVVNLLSVPYSEPIPRTISIYVYILLYHSRSVFIFRFKILCTRRAL